MYIFAVEIALKWAFNASLVLMLAFKRFKRFFFLRINLVFIVAEK